MSFVDQVRPLEVFIIELFIQGFTYSNQAVFVAVRPLSKTGTPNLSTLSNDLVIARFNFSASLQVLFEA